MKPYEWSKAEVAAIKATWAEPHGQLALKMIIERLGMLHGQSFDTDPVVMAFHEGRRYVARELTAVVNQPMEKIVKEPHEPRSSRPISATERAEQLAAGKPAAAFGAVAAARERLKR